MITDVLVRLGHNYKLLQSFFRATVQFSIASDDCNKACLSYHTQAVHIHRSGTTARHRTSVKQFFRCFLPTEWG